MHRCHLYCFLDHRRAFLLRDVCIQAKIAAAVTAEPSSAGMCLSMNESGRPTSIIASSAFRIFLLSRKKSRASAADSSRISTMFFPRYRWDNAASLYRFPPQSGQVFSDRKRFRRFHVLSRCSSGPFIRHSRWNWFLIPSIFLCSLGPSGVRLPYSRRFCSSGV